MLLGAPITEEQQHVAHGFKTTNDLLLLLKYACTYVMRLQRRWSKPAQLVLCWQKRQSSLVLGAGLVSSMGDICVVCGVSGPRGGGCGSVPGLRRLCACAQCVWRTWHRRTMLARHFTAPLEQNPLAMLRLHGNNAWVSLTLGAGVLVRYCVFIQGHQWQMRRDLLQ